jgi:hypothetical protein
MILWFLKRNPRNEKVSGRPGMRNMKIKTALTAVFLLVILLTISSPAYSQVVRGVLFRLGPYGPYPAVNVLLTLFSPSMGKRSAPSYTGGDGMYYFYNVPQGQYALEICQ